MTPTFANPDSRFCALRCGVAGAIRETMEARNKTAPTGAETPNAGASPTVKESTDG